MKILTSYVLTTFVKFLAFVLPVFVALYMVVEFVERIDDFLDYQARTSAIIQYFLLRAPIVAVQVGAVSNLLSAALTIAILARSRELIVLLAAGANPWRIVHPVLVGALVMAGITLCAEEYLLPAAQRGLMALQAGHKGRLPQGVVIQQGEIWLRTPEAAFVHIELVDPGGEHVHGVTIYRREQTGELFEQIQAREAVWLAGHWILLHGTISRVRDNLFADVEPFTRLQVPMGIEPQGLRSLFIPPSHMSLSDLRLYIQKLRNHGVDLAAYIRDFHLKLTTPLSNVVMAAVGLAAMWGTYNRRHITLGLVSALGGAAAYWLLTMAGTALSSSQQVSLLLGIWLPHLIVLGLALLTFWRRSRV